MAENVRARFTTPFLTRWRPALSALVGNWILAEQGRFLPWLPVFIASGNLFFFSASRMPPAWVAYALVSLMVSVLVLLWRSFLGRPVALCLCAAALGFASASIKTHALSPMPGLPRHAALVEGRVDAVDPLPQGRRVLLSAVRLGPDGVPLHRTLRIRLRGNDTQPILPGDRLRLRALLRPPYAPSFPGGWDQRRDAFFQNLAGVGFALAVAQRDAPARPSGLSIWWQGLREYVAARVLTLTHGTAGGVAATLLTGLSTAIPAADRQAFSTAGLSHILAVAGLHIGIVMTTVFVALRFALAHWPWVALRYPIKQIAGLAAIAVGGFYMAITGMHLPIIRSFIMAGLITLGLLAGRQAISLRGLALAASVLLLLQPQSLAGVSFQMSFGAVLVLIAGYERLRQHTSPLFRHRTGILGFLLRDLTQVALTSVIAATATAPFAAYHFGQIETYSIPANMLAVPLTAFWVLPCGLLGYALLPFHLAAIGFVPMGWGCSLLVWIARVAAGLPAAAIAVPPAPLWGLILAGFSLVWLCLWQTRLRLLGLPPLLLAVLVLPALHAQPDILVSPDYRLIAFRLPHSVYLLSATKDDFTLGEWRRFFGGRPVLPLPPDLVTAPGIVCAPQGCVLRQAAAYSTLLWRDDNPPGACDHIGFILSLRYWDNPLPGGCAGLPFVDRGLVQQQGATAVYLGTDPRIHTDRPARGDWPWLPPLEPPHENQD
ncbi:ComEC/Rec2 family competence protein [Acidisoma cellulosilytica]|uniref:ComEC/Rec2 family competence protein n=1 Tax=Acidisoma cellulosilyticum TaxID=2802395 RepID=A0A963YZL6_9PROT|nr:ComEC/Rec2 family competence protein [Acidisoma cellulosilyticum]MCB8879851.1 ComEC/Rec2 family competence protein [Acidisoma cellulosilyticum]